MASPELTMTQVGGLDPGATAPAATRVRVITPMVFWASLVPWARETREAEAICPALKPLVLTFSLPLAVVR